MKKQNLNLVIFLIFIGVFLGIVFFIFLSEKKVVQKNIEKQAQTQDQNKKTILAENSFGSLDDLNFQDNFSQLSMEASSAKTEAAISSDAISSSGGMGERMAIYPSIMPSENYQFVYVGGDFELPKEKVELLKRKKGVLTEEDVFWKNIFQGIGQSANLNLKDFEKLKASNFNFYQDKDFGLNFSLDFDNSSVYISAQWDRWQTLNQDCTGDQICYEKNRLTKKDLLSDEDFLKIADEFLKKIDFGMHNYEAGVLEKQNYFSALEEFVPETVSIFYQQKIENKKVFDISGNKEGLRVEIDVRQKKVRGTYPLINFDFFSSLYSAEESKDRIIEIAENGGWKKNNEQILLKTEVVEGGDSNYQPPEYPFEEKEKKKELKLDKPVLGWVKTWKNSQYNRTNEEIYIPAFVFPILEVEDSFWPKNIIVPAVKEN